MNYFPANKIMSVNQAKVLTRKHTGKLNKAVITAINNIKGPQKAQKAGVKKSFSRNPSIVS